MDEIKEYIENLVIKADESETKEECCDILNEITEIKDYLFRFDADLMKSNSELPAILNDQYYEWHVMAQKAEEHVELIFNGK